MTGIGPVAECLVSFRLVKIADILEARLMGILAPEFVVSCTKAGVN